MIPDRVRLWAHKNNFPRRILFSGGDDAFSLCLELASVWQKTDQDRIEKGLHTDTLVFRDLGKSFKIDFSEASKKDDQGEYENVRGLIRWCNQKPIESPYRIVILEHIERFSSESPHAFLKLLEEPPEYVVFLLTTRNHYQLLDTILSRVSVVRLPSLNFDVSFRDDVAEFFEARDFLDRIRIIETLQKQSKEEGEKMDRSIFYAFLENLISFLKEDVSKRAYFLDLVFETYDAISLNVNPRLALERLAIKIRKK